MRNIAVLLVLSVFAGSPYATVSAATGQDEPTTITFHKMPVQIAVRRLAESLHKPVAFDVTMANRQMHDVDEASMTRAEALERILRREGLFSVDVAGVLVVAPDTPRMRTYYSPERIAACVVSGDDKEHMDIVYHQMPVPTILQSLAQSISRDVKIDDGLAKQQRPYILELRNVSRVAAIEVLALVGHVDVHEDGAVLAFSAAAPLE